MDLLERIYHLWFIFSLIAGGMYSMNMAFILKFKVTWVDHMYKVLYAYKQHVSALRAQCVAFTENRRHKMKKKIHVCV